MDEESEVEGIAEVARGQLLAQSREPFSGRGFERLEDSIGRYIAAVIDESIRVAKRQSNDVVSASDVDQASRYLAAGTRAGRDRFLGIIGGAFLGAGLSGLLTLTTVEKPSSLVVGVTIVTLVIGTALVALELGRDMR